MFRLTLNIEIPTVLSSRDSTSRVTATLSEIGCGIKQCIKNCVKGGNGPIKQAKHALSVASSLVASDTEDTAGDQASIKTIKSPAVIEVTSDGEEPVDLEEELGMSSPYAFLTVSLI